MDAQEPHGYFVYLLLDNIKSSPFLGKDLCNHDFIPIPLFYKEISKRKEGISLLSIYSDFFPPLNLDLAKAEEISKTTQGLNDP